MFVTYLRWFRNFVVLPFAILEQAGKLYAARNHVADALIRAQYGVVFGLLFCVVYGSVFYFLLLPYVKLVEQKVVLAGVAAYILLILWPHIQKVAEFAVGRRETWYINSKGVRYLSTNTSLRRPADRFYRTKELDKSVIELNRGWFRRPSAIYGKAASFWEIVSVGRSSSGQAVIFLTDRRGLNVQWALELIDRFPSFLGMADRVNELEAELIALKSKEQELTKAIERWRRNADENRAILLAAFKALYQRINEDRQRFRAPAAQRIKDLIGLVLEGNPVLEGHLVSHWSRVFALAVERQDAQKATAKQ